MLKNNAEVAADILTSLIQNDKLERYDLQYILKCYRSIYVEVRALNSLSDETLAQTFIQK